MFHGFFFCRKFAALVPLRTVGVWVATLLIFEIFGYLTAVVAEQGRYPPRWQRNFGLGPAGGPDRADGPQGIKEGQGGPAKVGRSA